MSREAVAIIIGRAVTEKDFRQQLIHDAAKACKGYDLTPDELEALESIEQESLETFASSLPERLIKGVGGGLIVG